MKHNLKGIGLLLLLVISVNAIADPGGDFDKHQHLANGTVNSDWMYVYELAMNAKISDWLVNKL